MATLANVNGASLVPDFSAGLDNLFKGIQARRDEEANLAKQQQIESLIGGLTGQPVGAAAGGIDQGDGVTTYGLDPSAATPGINPSREEALIRLTSLDPKMAKGVREILESGDERQIEQVKQVAERDARTALLLEAEPTREGKQRVLRQIGEEIAASEGVDSPRFSMILKQMNMGDDELDLAIRRAKLGAADMGKLATDALTPKEAKAPITRELKVGDRIVTQQFNPETGAFEDIADAARFNPKAGVTVNLGGGASAVSERPLTAEEIERFNIDPEAAKGLVVDDKGKIKALDQPNKSLSEAEVEKAEGKREAGVAQGEDILNSYVDAAGGAKTVMGAVLPGPQRVALEQKRNALVAWWAKNVLGTPGAEPSPSLYEKADEAIPDFSGGFDRSNFNAAVQSLKETMKAGRAKQKGGVGRKGVNPVSGKEVTYGTFEKKFLSANPSATKADALKWWKDKYEVR